MKLSRNQIVTLLTDFGTKDTYVPQMKGVLLSLNQTLTIVDISHEVKPQNIFEGAFLLNTCYSFYPQKTIHIAVVDPGVGSPRAALLIETKNYYLIGPDNGILSLCLEKEKIKTIIELKNSEYFLKNVSTTFHGRDIFAPIAGHLSLGIQPAQFGPTIESINTLKIPRLQKHDNILEAQVIYTDHFGNMITNIKREDLNPSKNYKIKINKQIIHGISKTYSEKNPGELIALIGSSGYLEIAAVEGSALQKLSSLEKITLYET